MTVADVKMYEPDGTTFIAFVDDYLDLTAMEELEGQGGGSLTLAFDNVTLAAYPQLLAYRNVVKVKIGADVVAAFYIAKKTTTVVGEGAAASEAWTVSGPGLNAWLDESVLFHEFTSAYSGSTRWFNWGSKAGAWYTNFNWGSPTRVKKRGGSDFTQPGNPFRYRPANWPTAADGNVWWVWDRATAWQGAPAGDLYLRYPWTVAADDTNYRLYFTGKGRVDVLLDGEPLVKVRDVGAVRRTYVADFTLDAGQHLVALRTRNGGGFAGVIAVLIRVTEDAEGEEVETVVSRTGGTNWYCLAYPASEPGWTAGEVLGALLTEAQTRNVVSADYLTTGFTDDVDSDGVAWTRYFWSFGVGDTYWTVVQSMKDRTGTDIRVHPQTHVLDAWVSRGTDLSATVELTAAEHVQDLTEEIDVAIRNLYLVASDEGWSTRQYAASVSAYGRIEAYLDVGSLEGASATAVATATLQRAAIPAESVTVTYYPDSSNTPWADFNVGDRISVATKDGQTDRRVMSIAMRSNEQTGAVDYTIELDALSREQIDRLQRIIDNAQIASGMAGGGAPNQAGPGGGNGYTPNPARPAGPAAPPTNPGAPDVPPDDPGSGDVEFGMGDISATVAQEMMLAWNTLNDANDRIYLSLHTGELTATDGEWANANELSGDGYARLLVPLTAFAVYSGNDPVTRSTNTDLTWDSNSGATTWVITHIAVWDTTNAAIQSVVTLPTPISVGPNEAPQIPEGWFALEVSSI